MKTEEHATSYRLARISSGLRPSENLAGVLDTNTMAKYFFLITQKIWNI